MKLIATFLLIIAYHQSQVYAEETSTYTTKYDGVNLDEVLGNDRLFNNYVNCLLDNGPCTPDGKELKSKYLFYLTSVVVDLFHLRYNI